MRGYAAGQRSNHYQFTKREGEREKKNNYIYIPPFWNTENDLATRNKLYCLKNHPKLDLFHQPFSVL